jgi:hypothetical protein
MENISRGPTFGDLSLYAQRGQCRTSWLQDFRVQEFRLPSPPSSKCNVLRESLSVDSQYIPCAVLQRMGSWVISVQYISDEPKCRGRGGSCGVSANEYSCTHSRSPNKLGRSNSILNLCMQDSNGNASPQSQTMTDISSSPSLPAIGDNKNTTSCENVN